VRGGGPDNPVLSRDRAKSPLPLDRNHTRRGRAPPNVRRVPAKTFVISMDQGSIGSMEHSPALIRFIKRRAIDRRGFAFAVRTSGGACHEKTDLDMCRHGIGVSGRLCLSPLSLSRILLWEPL